MQYRHEIECFFHYRKALIKSASEFVWCTVQWFHLSPNIIIILQWCIYPDIKGVSRLDGASGVTKGGQGRTSAPVRSILGAPNWGRNAECYVIITKHQRMLIIAIYQILNGSGCCPVVKSHQDHQGSHTEQLRTFSHVCRRSFCLQQSVLECGLTDVCVTMLSDTWGCELSDFALILKLRHNRTGIQRSQCMQCATVDAFTATVKLNSRLCCYDNRSDV